VRSTLAEVNFGEGAAVVNSDGTGFSIMASDPANVKAGAELRVGLSVTPQRASQFLAVAGVSKHKQLGHIDCHVLR
jgi:hypothetical protein